MGGSAPDDLQAAQIQMLYGLRERAGTSTGERPSTSQAAHNEGPGARPSAQLDGWLPTIA